MGSSVSQKNLYGIIQKAINDTKEIQLMSEVTEEKITDVRKLSYGDSIRITREAVVSSVDTSEKSIRTKDNRTYRLEGTWGENGVLPGFTVVRLKPSEVIPEHWPIQSGDVWRDSEGKEYHVMSTPSYSYSGPRKINSIYTEDGTTCISDAKFKIIPGIKLSYRKGNSAK